MRAKVLLIEIEVIYDNYAEVPRQLAVFTADSDMALYCLTGDHKMPRNLIYSMLGNITLHRAVYYNS